MGFTTMLLTVSLLAIANGAAVWSFAGNDFTGFGLPEMGNNWPAAPALPDFGNMFSNFPKLPTVDSIRNTKPRPGESFSSMSVTSDNGRGTMIANVNGKTFEQQFGPGTKK